MGNILESGAQWLASQQEEWCSTLVTYHSAEGDWTREVPAMIGRSDYKVTDDYGVQFGASTIDFLIKATTLPSRPDAGDTITVSGIVYEAMGFGSDGVWRWTDGHCNQYRIHTKRVS